MTMFLSVNTCLIFSSLKYFNINQCRDLSCYYEVWILCKNCDLRISKCWCHFDVLQKTVKHSLKTKAETHQS